MPDVRVRRVASTVRFRVTGLAAVAVGTVLAATAVGLVVVQRRALTDSLDESLGAEAAAVAATLEGAPDPTDAGVDPPAVDDDALTQVVAGGVVVATSSDEVTRPVTGPPAGRSATRTVDHIPDEDEAFRVASRRVGGDRTTVVHVAAPLDDVEESTGFLAGSLAVTVPVVTTVLAAVVWALVGRTLRPVEAIRREVSRIGATDLGRRVPVPPGDDEVARLATTMNAMLDRVEDGAARQRRFVGDASHELRTPLARMRSEIEVDLAHPDRADPAATHRSVLDETIGMQRLVDDLLHLARADGARGHGAPAAAGGPAGDPGTSGLATGAARLDLAVAAEVSRARATSPVAVDAPDLAPVRVPVEAPELRRVVANLLDNATRHAHSHVEVGVDVAGDGRASVRLVVTDDGPGVPPGEAERIFERFARLDAARSAADGGAGLGLAIAREIAERHGGSLRLDAAHTGGARFILLLPSLPPRPGEPSAGPGPTVAGHG